jgi:bifunctional NMN adenylyltransferase/nudix hydrolase
MGSWRARVQIRSQGVQHGSIGGMSVRDLPTAVLIGRFQPPHRAHLAIMQEALQHRQELMIVLGSARSARTIRNPLSDAERADLLRAMLRVAGADLSRVRIEAVPDAFYNLPLWVRTVWQTVNTPGAVLLGFEKDASSFYLKLFPEWTARPPDLTSQLNATDTREALYTGDWVTVAEHVTPEVLAGLQAFAQTPEFAGLVADREAIRVLAGSGPVRTVGALLVAEGQMLLQPRLERPGLGLWAIPEAASLEDALGSVLNDVPADMQRVRERLLNNAQRTPGLDWQTRAGVYRVPELRPTHSGAQWLSLNAVYTQPERFFADHAQGIRALLEDWPA